MRARRILTALGAVFVVGGSLAACGVGQTPECEIYVSCQEHFDQVRNRNPANVNIYRPDGVCWENRELADDCTLECIEGTEDLVEKLTNTDDDLGPCGT